MGLRSRILAGTPATASGVGSSLKPCCACARVTPVARASSRAEWSPTATFLGRVRLSDVCICANGVMPATGEGPNERP